MITAVATTVAKRNLINTLVPIMMEALIVGLGILTKPLRAVFTLHPPRRSTVLGNIALSSDGSGFTDGLQAMWSYFRGWKRKIGVVTLLFTSVLTAGWTRSCFVEDRLVFFDGSGVSIVSRDQQISRLQEASDMVDIRRGWPAWRSTNKDARKVRFPTSKYSFLGFGREEEQFGYYFGIRYFVPYWSIVAPLTLLSAWCLLTKPRTKPATKREPRHE